MLGHTSGLRDQWELFDIQGRPLGAVAHQLGDVLELARKQRRLNFAPGTRDRRGQVNGFELFAGRVLHLRFDRSREP